jgi:NRPS condensation-like uncharacterized protein
MKRKLGKMETAQATTNEHFPFNAVIILRVTDGPSAETLKKLLEYLQHRHPLLGVHIHKEKGRYFFVSEGTPEIPLNVTARQNSGHWQRAAEQELNREFDMFTGPLVRFTYLTGSGSKKESEMIITFQHAVMDAVSGGHLIHEILAFCQEIESGGSIEKFKLVEPLPLLPPVETFFPPAFKGIRRKWHTFLFVLRQMGDEFRYRRRTRGKRKPPIHPAGKGKILPMKLPKETTAALIKASHQNRVTLNNLLTAAILMAAHKHLYNGETRPLRHVNTADLRPYLNPPLDPQYFGSYFAMMLFTVEMKEKAGVWELAREISDLVYSSLKRGDKFCANLLSYRMMRMLFRFKSFRMAASAMSYTGPVMLQKNYGKMELKEVHAFVSNFVVGPEYTALVNLFDNHIYWDILYLDSDMDHEQAGVIADEIRFILESAVKEES